MNSLVGRIAPPYAFQNTQNFASSLPLAKVAPELVVVHIVECQPVLDAVRTPVGRGQPVGLAAGAPALPTLGPDLQRPELVEGDRGSIGSPLVQVPSDQFFFERNFGSLHSFQVFVRCKRTLLARRICRIVSILIDSTIRSATT